MDNTQCGGQEEEIAVCRFDSWGENDCDPSEAAGVVCESLESKTPAASSVTAATADRPKKKPQKHKIKVNRNFFFCI